MKEDREKDKNFKLSPVNSRKEYSVDLIKSRYIAEGKSAKEIANEYSLSLEQVQRVIEENKLPELRKAYIKNGLENIQNIQLDQSKKLMDLENNFKKLRILQLEDQLNEFAAYYERHGHFYKLSPTTGKILRDTNGLPLQIKIPNVAKELQQLKESVTLSEGTKQLLQKIDDIIHSKPPAENINDSDSDIVEVDYKEIFGSNEE